MRRIAIARGPDGWSAEERWTSIRLKPYVNDFVVHEGHAFGFDGPILACIDVADGARKWKAVATATASSLCFPIKNLLLVLAEDGELALVDASPEKFNGGARFPAIEGKTWNHPVLVRDVPLARSSEEMIAFRLQLASGARVSPLQ